MKETWKAEKILKHCTMVLKVYLIIDKGLLNQRGSLHQKAGKKSMAVAGALFMINMFLYL